MGSLVGCSVVTKTGNYTATPDDCIILGDASGGAFTVTLPAASSTKQILLVKKIDSSVNGVTVARTGVDLIEGLTSIGLLTQNSARLLVSDGASKWYALSSL